MSATRSAEELARDIDEVLGRDDVQPGYVNEHGHGGVWCNKVAMLLLEESGRDTSQLLDENPHTGRPDPDWTSANDIASNAAAAAEDEASLVRQVDAYAAQELSNEDHFVIAVRSNAAGSGHIGVVSPDDETFDLNRGPLIAQGGSPAAFGINYADESFGAQDDIRYYVIPKASELISEAEDPRYFDADGDGLADSSFEVADPLLATIEASVDVDGDGLDDFSTLATDLDPVEEVCRPDDHYDPAADTNDGFVDRDPIDDRDDGLRDPGPPLPDPEVPPEDDGFGGGWVPPEPEPFPDPTPDFDLTQDFDLTPDFDLTQDFDRTPDFDPPVYDSFEPDDY